MLDPLSATSGSVVAKAANGAAALASTLYGLIATARSPPPSRGMKSVAAGVRDLSNELRELRSILQQVDRSVFRRGLFESVHLSAERTQGLLERIRRFGTLGDDGNAGTAFCARWRTEADGLLVEIESLKLALGLVLAMISLVWEQDMQGVWMREGEGDGTTFFRKQVQTTIQAIKQFIQDAFSVAPTARDIGTQTHELNQPFASKSSDDRSPANSEDPPSIVSAEFVNKKDPNLTESETERENSVSSAQDTARWLYAFLSGDITTYSLNAENLLVSTMVSESTKIHETGTIDRLLRSWSRLKDDKIRDLQDAKELPRPSEGENDAATKRRSHDYAFVRASMQQIVSKALSYAQHSKSHESLSSKRDSQHHDVQRAPREDGNDKRAMRVSIHAKEVEVEHLQEDKWHSEAQHEGSAERKTTPPPPQHRAASRHRSKSASWVLGHRRVRSQSSDGRVTTAPTSVSTNNPSSSGLSYARTIGWKKSHQTSRSLDSPVVRISSSTTSIDKCVPQQTPDRSSHCPPPQKVLFTTPVARIASPSTVGLSSTSSTSTITTAKNASIGSSITKPSSPPLQPAKGILKPPTHHFPEELNPIREGVTLHKLDRMNKDAPPGAKWTKIKRSWVNPEALTMGKERFEVLGDHVKVLRVLSRDEIEAYRIATAQLRAMREDGPKEDEDRSQKKKGSGDGADKRDGADGRRQSPPSRYVGQRSGGRMGKKGSPSPPHRREDGKVP